MKHFYYLMSLLLLTNIAIAQSTITGNVTDDLGVPLPGATILEVGTSNGTTTDFDGNYSITVQEGASISASFVGYETSDLLRSNIPWQKTSETKNKMKKHIKNFLG